MKNNIIKKSILFIFFLKYQFLTLKTIQIKYINKHIYKNNGEQDKINKYGKKQLVCLIIIKKDGLYLQNMVLVILKKIFGIKIHLENLYHILISYNYN